MTEPKPGGKVTYRLMRLDDVEQVIALEAASFPSIPPDRYWQPAMLAAHVERCPEAQFVAERDGRIVGSATGFRLPLETALRHHTWREITGGGYLSTHHPGGDALYGTEIMVHPEARRGGIARHLYTLRKDLIRRENMRAFVTGGRIPGYEKHAARMTAATYVKRVIRGDIADRTLTAQLKSGLTVAGVLSGYLTDPRSLNHATLLVWWNLDYVPDAPGVPSAVSPPRLTRTLRPHPETPEARRRENS